MITTICSDMGDIDYYDYIQSPEWKEKEKEFIERVGYCQKCKTTERLSAHHKSYENLGNETILDVEILCWDCHKKYAHHNIPREPMPRTRAQRMEVWEKDSRWREIEPTLPFHKKVGPEKLPKIKLLVKLKDYRKEVYYEKGKFKPHTPLTWLKKVKGILNNIFNIWIKKTERLKSVIN